MTNCELERDVAEYVAFIFREVQAETGSKLSVLNTHCPYMYLIFSDDFFPDLIPPSKMLGMQVLEIPSALFRSEYTFGLCIGADVVSKSIKSAIAKVLAMQNTFPFYDDSWRKEVGLK